MPEWTRATILPPDQADAMRARVGAWRSKRLKAPTVLSRYNNSVWRLIGFSVRTRVGLPDWGPVLGGRVVILVSLLRGACRRSSFLPIIGEWATDWR